ncbi:predicted protein [Postia placenta Mad-698-R]|uniref:DUF6534 domain-containing protein n=1 Tax=Postia placenta MAD-698-R-SB12 TaxID=670580 RepID=A0A1X6MQQ6_9APHY|nr:hypothetical protein POSPLADRAFT_1152820 [Postia placenta MAD-698-R-SB12]EED79653.1 predicted protein [Postia placenta Mad-698-R]OSX58522.1 hypothetical protein POSPLADRAFT_1152820 [Postia placenta MAD-698-R-SB12]
MELDLNSNMGCFFIGVMIATPLFGLTCAQVMYYMREYPGDMLGMKILVLPTHDLDPSEVFGRKFYKLPVVGTLVGSSVHAYNYVLIGVNCDPANCAIGLVDPTLPGVYQRTRVSASVQPVTASVTDVCITVCLCWALHNENTGLNRTDTLVRKLMVYAINRGILTSVIQVGQAVAYLAANTTLFYWSMFHFPGSKGSLLRLLVHFLAYPLALPLGVI